MSTDVSITITEILKLCMLKSPCRLKGQGKLEKDQGAPNSEPHCGGCHWVVNADPHQEAGKKEANENNHGNIKTLPNKKRLPKEPLIKTLQE